MLEYVDPATGGSVIPALGCYLQMLRPGARTRAHRETASAVYHVAAGHGVTEVDGAGFDWNEGDFFAVPPGAWHAHANPGPTPAVLYSVQDVPLLKRLGLYRMEPSATAAGGPLSS
jgi:gentisate 1,2-dioxygenase